MRIEITKQAFESMIDSSGSLINQTERNQALISEYIADGMLLIEITNYQSSQPITQYYAQDINA